MKQVKPPIDQPRHARLRCLGSLFLAFLICPVSSSAQEPSVAWPVFNTQLTQTGKDAIVYLTVKAAPADAPVPLTPEPKEEAAFCADAVAGRAGVFVAPLSVFSRCFPAVPSMAAFDFPFLASDWNQANKLLAGPVGLSVAQGFATAGHEVLFFWQGEARILASETPIMTAKDLQGQTVLGPATYASTNAAIQLGASAVALPLGERYEVAQADPGRVIDVPLAQVEKLPPSQGNILLSNHSLDPIVLVAPTNALQSLGAVQRGFLESALADATQVQKSAARSQETLQKAALIGKGVNVTALTNFTKAGFASGLLVDSSVSRAANVFAMSPAALKNSSLKQVRNEDQSVYVKVLFVTNRVAAKQVFGTDFASQLTYGRASVELAYDGDSDYDAPSLGIAARLTDLFTPAIKGKGVQVNWAATTKAPFAKDQLPTLPSSPSKASLLYVHGFANSFDEALQRGAWLSWNVGRPVLAFSWPSRGVPLPASYLTDRETADKSVQALVSVLEMLGVRNGMQTDIDLVVHSMGARVMLGALKVIDRKPVTERPRFRRLIMVAPDIPTSELAANWNALRQYFGRDASLYISDHDRALGISKTFMNPGEGQRAGLAPPVFTTAGVESIFIGRNDFSLTGHSYHVSNNAISRDLIEALKYGANASERWGQRRPPGKDYFVIQGLEGL